MLRLLAAAVALAFAAGAASAQEAKKVSVRWFGQSFFQIVSAKGTRIVIDPHAIPEYGRPVVSADLVLLTHLHDDHTQVGVLENATAANKPEIVNGLNPKNRGKTWNKVDMKFRDVHVRGVRSFHDEDGGMRRGKNTIFVIEVDGLKFVHLGDLGHPLEDSQVKEIGPVDVLMIPVGGIYTINGAQAKKVVQQLKPRLYVLPMHYGTKAYEDLPSAQEFIEGQKNVRKLPGNLLTIPTDLKLDQPTIVLMGWQ